MKGYPRIHRDICDCGWEPIYSVDVFFMYCVIFIICVGTNNVCMYISTVLLLLFV